MSAHTQAVVTLVCVSIAAVCNTVLLLILWLGHRR